MADHTQGEPPALTAQTRRRAEEWLAADPDPETRSELEALLAGDPVELERRFEGRLAFGTAGIRGPMGAGPMRMNRVLVRMVAAALAERLLQEREERSMVVVSYDARHRSHVFATDTARVLAARGIRVEVLPGPMPTPVLAFAVKHLDASAGVMVTASHNPRSDNGYKVYWRGGHQLAPPIDTEIGEIIDRTAPLSGSDLASDGDFGIEAAGDDLVEAYVDAVAGLLVPGGPRSVRMAYTPLHGVGAETFLRAVSRAGFDPPEVVAEQAEPDPDFGTAPFPNPEETGVVDQLLALAADTGADVALAHDPDADRLAVAVPEGGRWRLLTGDETGCLLAEHLLRRAGPDDGPDQGTGRHRLVINTVVSSRLLPLIAAAHDADWIETLTGFKWIMQAHSQRAASHELVLGYEEALGYAVGEVVRDKDGIGAALVMAELVAALKSEERTLGDLLDGLHRRHGVHATGQRSVRFESAVGNRQPMKMAMAALRDAPPTELGGAAVTAVHDLAAGGSHLPPADVVVLELFGIEARVIVRPSGTEPKMKVYAEAVVVLGDGDDDRGTRLRSARGEARTRIAALLDAAVRHVADPERHGRDRALAAAGDTGTGVAGTGDTATGEAGTGDTATGEAGTGDTATGEAGTGDTATGEAGTGDTATGEAGTGDTATGEAGTGDTATGEAGTGDTATGEAGTGDTATGEAGTGDTATGEAGTGDTATGEAGTGDTATGEAGTGDTATGEAGTGDTATGEAGTGDTATGEAGTGDTATGEAGTGDTATGEAGTGDTATGEAGTGDTATGEAGTGDTATGEAGTGDTATGEAGTGDTATGVRGACARPVGRALHRPAEGCTPGPDAGPADPTVGPVAAVCVHPSLAGLAAELLAGTPVAVASVAGAFPSGLSPLEVKVAEVRAAVAAGAQEIDTVLNRSAFLSGRADLAAGELRALREAAGTAHFKVILEVCELGSATSVAEATRLAIDSGADMVKTSTGKGSAGASPQAVLTMATTVAEHCAAGGRPVGIKVAGGVRTAADALGYLAIVRSVLGDDWLSPERLRFGASSLLGNVVAELAGSTAG